MHKKRRDIKSPLIYIILYLLSKCSYKSTIISFFR
nr:MAG TPA: hypothetical protein [Bacteriophage sp.]